MLLGSDASLWLVCSCWLLTFRSGLGFSWHHLSSLQATGYVATSTDKEDPGVLWTARIFVLVGTLYGSVGERAGFSPCFGSVWARSLPEDTAYLQLMWPTDHGPQVQWCEGPDVKQKAVLFEQLEYMLRTCDPSFCPSFPPDWKHCVVFLQGPWSSLTHWCEWLPFLVLLLGVLGGSRRIACFFRDFIIPQNGTKGYIRKMFVISCVQSLERSGEKATRGQTFPCSEPASCWG